MENSISEAPTPLRMYLIRCCAVSSPFLYATAIGVLSMTPPEYNLARCLVIGASLGVLVAAVLWLSTTTEMLYLKLSTSVFLVLFGGLGQPLSLWWISRKETIGAALTYKNAVENNINIASQNLSTLTEEEIRTKVVKLANSIRDFESKNKIEESSLFISSFNPKDNAELSHEKWREQTAKIINQSTKNSNNFRRIYLPDMTELLREMQTRVVKPIPALPSEAQPAFSGMLAGVRPASAAADYLEQVASLLP